MILSVAVLGSNDATPLPVVGSRFAECWEGGRAIAGDRCLGTLVELPSPEGGSVAFDVTSAGFAQGSSPFC